jgi:threonine dehydratase
MKSLFALTALEDAAELVRRAMPPTPQYAWPLLRKRTGLEVWVKHENHTPAGAFKVRGGLVYMDALRRSGDRVAAVTSATRGNHGQSIAFAATRAGLRSVIFVPHGNSPEKNRAMEAFGAELVVHGRDFDEAKAECSRQAQARGLHFVPSFHPDLVKGVATYALELMRAAPDLDVIYAPIGLGSGICGLITARNLLGLKTEIVGVVSDRANAYSQSFAAGRRISTATALTFADGVAVREPSEEALTIIRQGAARVVEVSDDEAADAIRMLWEDTHNVAEGAGAVALAALMKERNRLAGQRAAVIVSGGNIDRGMLAEALAGRTPRPA